MRKGTLLEAMTGRTALSSDGLLAEVFRGFPQSSDKCQEICAQPPGSYHYHPLSLATDANDPTLEASGLWLGTRTGVDGTATLA